MKDTTKEPGFFEMDNDGTFDVQLYDLRVGDSQLTTNLKLLALGYVLTRIFDTIVASYNAQTLTDAIRLHRLRTGSLPKDLILTRLVRDILCKLQEGSLRKTTVNCSKSSPGPTFVPWSRAKT